MALSGNKIKQLRILRGMTQSELADKVGVAQSFVSDLEYGKKFPKTTTLEKIAEVLGVSINRLPISRAAIL